MSSKSHLADFASIPGVSQQKESSKDLTHDPKAQTRNEPRPLIARKRRRTTKACNDCQRRKIKCNGGQPCTSCADFNSECSYSKLSVRGRSVTTEQKDSLERKLHVAESLIRKYLPHVDFKNLEATSPAQLSPTQPHAAPVDASERSADSRTDDDTTILAARAMGDGMRIIPLVKSVGQLELNDSGEYDFHGMSSGAAFLDWVTKQFPWLFRYDSRMPFLPHPQQPLHAKPLELPVYSASRWSQENYDFLRLPQRQLAHNLCQYSFSRASCLLRVVHTPSFWKMFESTYTEGPQSHTHEQRRFVGLLFSVIALGSMYDVDENDPTNPDHYAVAMERGYKFYASARHYLQDITECCDIITLQALVFIIQFLQATGNLNGCHTFVGIALRSALRMGLHRHLPHSSVTPIEDETRKRLFHTIRQMDIYLSTTLGLPLLLQERDIDQPWPTEVDDEYITDSGINQPPPGTSSFLEAFNAHIRLMRILAKVVEHLYPPTGMDRGPTDVTYTISFAKIREIEQDLHQWHENLSSTWLPGPEKDRQTTRVKILLRFAYAHVQLVLYRPFIQYYPSQRSGDETADEFYHALATTGINVCRNIIHIGLEIRKQAVLIGPYWFITYTQFFAILSLLWYALNSPDHREASELFADAKLGKDCISGMTQRSLAADRVTLALDTLFNHLPDQFNSTDSPAHHKSPMYTSSAGQTHLGHRSAIGPQQSVGPSILAPQEHWRTSPFTTSHKSGAISQVSALPCTPIMAPTAPISRSIDGQYSTNVMNFLIEDPFAYPLFPGVSLADNEFASLDEEVLHLTLANMQMDLSHMSQPPLAGTEMPQ